MPVYLWNIYVIFLYQGHQVKVKVTGPRNRLYILFMRGLTLAMLCDVCLSVKVCWKLASSRLRCLLTVINIGTRAKCWRGIYFPTSSIHCDVYVAHALLCFHLLVHGNNISLTFADEYLFNFLTHLCCVTDDTELVPWPFTSSSEGGRL